MTPWDMWFDEMEKEALAAEAPLLAHRDGCADCKPFTVRRVALTPIDGVEVCDQHLAARLGISESGLAKRRAAYSAEPFAHVRRIQQRAKGATSGPRSSSESKERRGQL